MTSLLDFPATRKWPPQHPDRLQLYTLGTPNGHKISIYCEETGLPYEAHKVSFQTQDQFSPEFLALNPNNKIPAIIDPDGPGGQPLALWESGAILLYLAEKTGKLLPADARRRYLTLQWLFFQVANVGPLMGQLGFFHKYAGAQFEDKRPRDRYAAETRRQLDVMNRHLRGRKWFMDDDYTIADIAIFPWINGTIHHYEAGELVGFKDFPEVARVLEAFMSRPAVQRGRQVP